MTSVLGVVRLWRHGDGRSLQDGTNGNNTADDDVHVVPLESVFSRTGQQNSDQPEMKQAHLRARQEAAAESDLLPFVSVIVIIVCVAISALVIIFVFSRGSHSRWFRPKVPFKWVVEPGPNPTLAVRVWAPDSSKQPVIPPAAKAALAQFKMLRDSPACMEHPGMSPGDQGPQSPQYREEDIPVPPNVLPPLLPKAVRVSVLQNVGLHDFFDDLQTSQSCEHPTLASLNTPPIRTQRYQQSRQRANTFPSRCTSSQAHEKPWKDESSRRRAYSQPHRGFDSACDWNLPLTSEALAPKAYSSASSQRVQRPRHRSPVPLATRPLR